MAPKIPIAPEYLSTPMAGDTALHVAKIPLLQIRLLGFSFLCENGIRLLGRRSRNSTESIDCSAESEGRKFQMQIGTTNI